MPRCSNLQENTFVIEAHQTVAVRQDLGNLRGQFAIAEGELGPLPHVPSGAHQALPGLLSPVDQQQHLAGTAPRQPLAQQAGGQDPGIVQNQAVAGIQKVRQFIEMVMLPGTGVPVQGHKPGAVPPFQRRLRDQLLGQFVIEIACFHGFSSLKIITES